MKRTLILLAILLCLGGAYYFISTKDDDKIEAIMAEREFAVERDEIEKVVITDKNGVSNTITHEGDIWYINGNRINNNQRDLLIEALTRVRMQSIPPKGALPQIMKTIGRIGILVRVFGDNDELLSSYYVGGVPQGERGTYYLMEGYSQPYLMSIPGMDGSTRGRFVKQMDYWLDRAMFRYPNRDIKKISVDYPRSKNDSYIIEKNGGDFEVKTFYDFTPKIQKPQNDRLLEDYLENYYTGFFTEAYANNHVLKDSVRQFMNPFCNISIEDEKGEETTLVIYPYNEVEGFEGNARGPNVDKFIERYYVDVNDGENFMLTQHIIAKKFLWGYSYFFR